VNFWESFWEILWFSLWAFFFVVYLMALFAIIGDIFRDKTLGGVGKAVWLFFLIFVPFLTALVYLIARGDGMAQRNMRDAKDAQVATDEYIRSVAKASPSDEIAKAKSLLDAGTINQQEYEAIKARALSA
jgi:Short C-terminal domain/Phospholipase_D-nuclease N-terminal